MQGGHAIHVMGANRGEVSHADRLTTLLINDREFALNCLVARVAQAHLLQEAAVDFVNQLEVSGQQASKQVEVPFLECLGKQGVVGVSHGTAGDIPSLVPFHVAIIDQQTHQFCDRDGGVGVVELNGPVLREVVNRKPTVIQAAQHVLEGAAHKEVLLFKAQAASLIGAIVGIQHFGKGFAAHFLFHSAVVIADVEGVEIKAFRGVGAPEAQAIAGVHAVAEHGHIVGHADGVIRWDPARAVVALVVEVALRAATKAHKAGLVGLGQFPGPAALQPLVGDLHLPTIADQLIKNPEFVADAIAGGRDLQTGERFHVASG